MERRSFLKSLSAVPALGLVSLGSVNLLADAKKAKPKGKNAITFKKALSVITDGKGAKESSKVKLIVPEIAENGAVVPVKVNVDEPIENVKSIHVLSTKNSNARCADVFLSPRNGKAYFATRIKLSGTQEVVAVAVLKDGSAIMAKKPVKVTIGGCG
ncbi:thiosulfate oxidation carrier protein SoxY [Nitratiruptor tergarcus]|uniref:Sulfur-oxidizing protein SoxY n=1 Tax=Nitratiruptor tergarcus DSM 16512 TaxID=1069081 RepID=A0A1W1WQS4_9BACT|nr:thiosulfate oxidation carrier protein SoxY [Nitratiruptor tergarcus]SMC08647.1 sulfur-oxidizing protein SoxY [Nitratiruptor tergarcus DSM 16512]